MAMPRYRRAGRRRSVLAGIGITAGIATIATMAYAVTAIVLAPTSIALPAPAHWVARGLQPPLTSSATANSANQPSAPAVDTGAAAEPDAAAALDPLEAERLELGQSVGTAAFVLEQTASADGTWPASLAITTDGATLLSPGGIVLAPIPAGAQVLYSTSSDRSEYSLTMIGPSGVTATVTSTTGVVETSVP